MEFMFCNKNKIMFSKNTKCDYVDHCITDEFSLSCKAKVMTSKE